MLLSSLVNGQGLYQVNNHSKTASGWGMSSAVSSLNNSIDGVFLNPASLAQSPNFYHANFTKFVLDVSSTSIGIGLENKYFKYAVNVSYMNFGEFDEKDSDGNKLGTFSANDKEISLSIAKKLGNYISAGVSTAFISSNIQNYTATALSGGIGLQYFHPEQNLAIGLSYRNMDYQISNYNDKDEYMPNLAILGISKKLQYLPATASFDLMSYGNSDIMFNAGAKFQPNSLLSIFIGTGSKKFQLQNRSDISSLVSGISLGAGVEIKKTNFDISYSSLGDAGQITSFSFYRLLN